MWRKSKESFHNQWLYDDIKKIKQLTKNPVTILKTNLRTLKSFVITLRKTNKLPVPQVNTFHFITIYSILINYTSFHKIEQHNKKEDVFIFRKLRCKHYTIDFNRELIWN